MYEIDLSLQIYMIWYDFLCSHMRMMKIKKYYLLSTNKGQTII